MRLAVLLATLSLAACGSSPARSPSQLIASDVVEVAAPPPGYDLGDKLSETCRGRRGLRPIDDEALADVDCGIERLSRALRARAAELHAPYLIQKTCRARGGDPVRITCSARLGVASRDLPLSEARPRDDRPAPSAERVLDLDEPRPQDGREIRVSFAPDAKAPGASRLRPRQYDRVAQTAEPSVGRRELGQLSARCPGCEPSALHHALRVTAGRLGAGEVSAVRCFEEDGGRRCVATALEPWSY